MLKHISDYSSHECFKELVLTFLSSQALLNSRSYFLKASEGAFPLAAQHKVYDWYKHNLSFVWGLYHDWSKYPCFTLFLAIEATIQLIFWVIYRHPPVLLCFCSIRPNKRFLPDDLFFSFFRFLLWVEQAELVTQRESDWSGGSSSSSK